MATGTNTEKKTNKLSKRSLQAIIVEMIKDCRRTYITIITDTCGMEITGIKMTNAQFANKYSFIKDYEFTDASEQRWCTMAKKIQLEKELDTFNSEANIYHLWNVMKKSLEEGIENPFEKNTIQQYEERQELERQASQELDFTKLFEDGITKFHNLKLECIPTQLHNNPSARNVLSLEQEQQANIEPDM